jgi:hypothetical protein
VCGCVQTELLLHRQLNVHESDCLADENQATFSGKRVGPEYFGVVWTGFLKPSASGVYTINTVTVTTDTAVLTLNGALLIDCRTMCMDETARLVQGVMYALRLEYRSFEGHSSISLRGSSGHSVPYEVIPSGNLLSSVVAGSLSVLTFRALPNVVDSRNTLMWGAGLTIATAGVAATFDVRMLDQFGNVAWNVVNLNVLLHPIGSMFQRSRYQSQQTALGPNAIQLNGNLPIAATYYLTSGMYATYYNAALRATAAFTTKIAATYYSWSVSITLPTKGTGHPAAALWCGVRRHHSPCRQRRERVHACSMVRSKCYAGAGNSFIIIVLGSSSCVQQSRYSNATARRSSCYYVTPPLLLHHLHLYTSPVHARPAPRHSTEPSAPQVRRQPVPVPVQHHAACGNRLLRQCRPV